MSDKVRRQLGLIAILALFGCERRSFIMTQPSERSPFLLTLEEANIAQPFLAQAQVNPKPQAPPPYTAMVIGLGELGTLDARTDALFDAPVEDTAVVKVPGTDARGSCQAGMVLVDGEACTEVEHTCLRKMEDDPAHRCLEFKVGADQCIAPRGKLHFCMDRYEWPGTPGAQPRVLVDYYEAEKLCKSVGKRMCKEDEFYLACEGPEHWPYAWGHVRHPSPCNIDRPYLMVDWQKWAKGREAMTEEARRLDQALPIGSSKCWSPYGIHDIAGNVDEWTTSRPGRDLEGSLNGGYWGPVQNACRYVTLVHGPEFLFYQIGFRCCSEAK